MDQISKDVRNPKLSSTLIKHLFRFNKIQDAPIKPEQRCNVVLLSLVTFASDVETLKSSNASSRSRGRNDSIQKAPVYCETFEL